MYALLQSYLPMLQLHALPLILLLLAWVFLCAPLFIHQRALQPAIQFVIAIIRSPIIFLSCIFVVYFSLFGVQVIRLEQTWFSSWDNVLAIGEFITLFWLTFNTMNVSKQRLMLWSEATNHPTINTILPNIEQSLNCILLLVMTSVLIPLLNLDGKTALVLDKLSQILLISMLGYFCYQLVNIGEKIVITQYITNNRNVFSARKINTQLLILKRFIISLIVIVTLAAILMLFEAVSGVGKGLLTTAGIVSAVGAFASQQSLSRIFAGLQIAFAQPIRIGDTVIIENEFGQIEEITLLYVVVKLWDLRRLILPTDHFTSRGLQNLTHDSSQLLGTVFFYTDYTLPVDEVRKKFLALLDASPLWDRKVGTFQVTNLSEKAMELRGVMSAADASTLWNLRCEIREAMIQYIVANYPGCLSLSRTFNTASMAQLHEELPSMG